MENKATIYSIIDGAITYSWLGILALTTYISKKVVDFAFKASFEKFSRIVADEVRNECFPIKEDIKKIRADLADYRENHHGAIQKNEAVLNLALDILEKYEKKKQ